MKRVAFVLMTLTAFTFFSCSDSEMDEVAGFELESADLSSEETIASAFEDADVISDAGFDSFVDASGRGIRDEILGCAMVEHDTVANVITIDYADGCEGPKGRVRKGKIILEYSGGRSFAVGAFRRVTFDGFMVDSTTIAGVRTHMITAVDSEAGIVTAEITLEGGSLTFGDGTTATREANWTRVWSRNDNTTTVTGGASGINRNGDNYTVEIIEDILFARGCWAGRIFVPVSGTKQFTVGENVVTLDYGDGSCDNLATVTYGDVTEEVVLSLRGRRR